MGVVQYKEDRRNSMDYPWTYIDLGGKQIASYDRFLFILEWNEFSFADDDVCECGEKKEFKSEKALRSYVERRVNNWLRKIDKNRSA